MTGNTVTINGETQMKYSEFETMVKQIGYSTTLDGLLDLQPGRVSIFDGSANLIGWSWGSENKINEPGDGRIGALLARCAPISV